MVACLHPEHPKFIRSRHPPGRYDDDEALSHDFSVFAVIKDFIALEIVAQFDDIFFNIYNSSNLS